MEIAYMILVSVVALGSLALAYLVVRRLPKSDYREAEILGQNILAAWQQGNDFGRMSREAGGDPGTAALTLASPPPPEPIQGPFDDESDERLITGQEPEPLHAVN